MVRRLMIAVALVAGTLLVAPSAAGAHGGHGVHGAELACPTDDQPLPVTTDVRLSHDLHCRGTIVEWDLAPGVTVDLGGHRVVVRSTLRCSVGVPGCTFEVGSGTLRNGRLDGADVNVGDGVATGLGIRGGLAEVTRTGTLTRSVIDGGPAVIERGGHLTHSWVVRGTGVLLSNLNHSLTDFDVSDNVIVGNTGNGIGLNTHFFFADDVTGTIARNLVSRNTGAGISLTGDLRDLGAVQISQNLVTANGGTGIVVSGSLDTPGPPITGGPVTITKNSAMFNAGQGINAPWIPAWPNGVVDGGGNRAFHNATAPACVGVICASGPHHKP